MAERAAIDPARDDDVLSLLRGDRRGLDARERQQEDGEREEGEKSPLPPAASQAAVSQAAGLQLRYPQLRQRMRRWLRLPPPALGGARRPGGLSPAPRAPLHHPGRPQ